MDDGQCTTTYNGHRAITTAHHFSMLGSCELKREKDIKEFEIELRVQILGVTFNLSWLP